MTITIIEHPQDSAFIKRRKKSLLKKYSPTRSRSLEEANHLAVYLYSLERSDEAEQLLDSYCEYSPFEKPRYERWEAACFAMLFNAHIKQEKGAQDESKRLLKKVDNELFKPNHWFGEHDADEFIRSIQNGSNAMLDCSHNDICQHHAEAYLALLYALYFWSRKWVTFQEREHDIHLCIKQELNRIKSLIV